MEGVGVAKAQNCHPPSGQRISTSRILNEMYCKNFQFLKQDS